MFLKAVWIALFIASDIIIFRAFACSEENEICELEIIFAFNWDSEFFKVFAWLRKSKRIVDSNESFSDDFDELVRWLDNENEFSWDVSEQRLNRKLSRLWMNLIIEQIFVEFKNLWIILTSSFFVNCLKYTVNAVKLTNADFVNQWRFIMIWFRVRQSINQSAENENVNLTLNDFFKFKETALQCFFKKLTDIAFCESIEDFIFLEMNKIIARVLFWILSCQVINEFNS